MIKIELKLFATLSHYLPNPSSPFFIEQGTTIGQVASKLGIADSELKLTFVNGIQQPLEHILNDGDRVGIFPPVGGG